MKQRYTRIQCRSVSTAVLALVLWVVPPFLAHNPAHRACASSAAACSSLAAETPFLAENDTAMKKMMVDMAVQPTGDIDRDFVSMMVAHHQGAIDMALALLRYGDNEQLKRLAQEIIVTQQQEIAVMRLAVAEPLPPPVASPTRIPTDARCEHAVLPHGMKMKSGH